MQTWKITSSLLMLAMAGCLPEKRVVWTADGTRAAVIAEEAIYLIDGEGRILKPRISAKAGRCAWARDGTRLVVAHAVEVAGWKEIEVILTPEQRASIVTHAKELKPRALAFEGDWRHFDFNPDRSLSGGMQVAALMYLRDRDAAGLSEKLGEKWKEIEEIKPQIRYLDVFALSGDFKHEKTLLRSVDDVPLLMVSPDDRFVAFNMEVWQGTGCEGLFVVPLTGIHPPRLVDESVAMNFDWSADGHSLAYVRAAAAQDDPDMLQLGSLCTRAVRDKNGELLADWGKREDRVAVLFQPYAGIEWLRDGRIFFSSVQAVIPAVPREIPERWSLFSHDPRNPASVLNVLGANFEIPLDSDFPIFEVSPDEGRILLLCEQGQIAVYDIARGESEFVLTENRKSAGLSPTWKSNQEISFAYVVEEAGKEHVRVSLWRHGMTRDLSPRWPDELTAGWLREDTKNE